MKDSEVLVFRSSCPKCGVFQEKLEWRCSNVGCIAIHIYPPVYCECGEQLN